MATYKLTTTDPTTGLTHEALGWHFTMSTALDVLEGCIFAQKYDWNWMIYPFPDDESLQELSFISKEAVAGPSPKPQQLKVNDSQWFTVDGQGNINKLEADDVATDYAVTAWTPPA